MLCVECRAAQAKYRRRNRRRFSAYSRDWRRNRYQTDPVYRERELKRVREIRATLKAAGLSQNKRPLKVAA